MEKLQPEGGYRVITPDDRLFRASVRGTLVKCARVQDVVVAPDWRGRGVGKAVVRLLLDHPAVRRCGTVYLSTRDAQPLYRSFGFVEDRDHDSPVWTFTRMVLRRSLR